MRPCNPGKAFKTILFVEAILIFSIISSLLICILIGLFVSSEDFPKNETAARHVWIENYKILNFFLDQSESGQEENSKNRTASLDQILKRYRTLQNLNKNQGPAIPLIQEFLKIKTVETQIERDRLRNIPQALFKSIGDYSFFNSQKKILQLKYYHTRKQYARVVEIYNAHPLKNREIRVFYLHSLIKTGKGEEAGRLFNKLFQKSHLSSFRIIPSTELNRLIYRLKDEFWYQKLYYLAKKNAFREIYREKKYIRSPDMAALYNAEYHFRRHRYQRSGNFLKRVKSKDLLAYKHYLSLKIQLRKAVHGEYEPILIDIEKLKNNPPFYTDLILNAANTLLIEGNLKQAHRLYQQFALNRNNTGHSDYWKAIWISAWIQFKSNQKNRALEYFQKGMNSPILPYRIANQFWTSQLKKKFSHELDLYPFSYYYTRLENHPSMLTRKILKRFTTLINGAHGPLFPEVISALKFLIKSDATDDVLELVKLTKHESRLTDSDRNMIKLIESIIYLKKRNYYQAFIHFKKNFPCYECFYLPQFLSEIFLPIQYEDLIKKYSQEHDLDPYLVLALIREESFFRSDVVSSARACGLMQILYGTAREISRKTGYRVTRNDLFIPEINIRLGTSYLKSLINKYNGETHLALAAYNAGDNRVDRWIDKFGNAPEKEFIEMIPFTETRTYVKNIYRNYYFYRFYNLKSHPFTEP